LINFPRPSQDFGQKEREAVRREARNGENEGMAKMKAFAVQRFTSFVNSDQSSVP